MSSPIKLAKFSMLLAAGLILSYIESIIPIHLGMPGAKLGLANLLVLLLLYSPDYGTKDAALYNLMRILLSGFLFGNGVSIIYSLAGALVSLIAMSILKYMKVLTVVGVSVCGGVFHNIGQLMIAMIILPGMKYIYYLPFLILFGTITGILIGKLAEILIKREKV